MIVALQRVLTMVLFASLCIGCGARLNDDETSRDTETGAADIPGQEAESSPESTVDGDDTENHSDAEDLDEQTDTAAEPGSESIDESESPATDPDSPEAPSTPEEDSDLSSFLSDCSDDIDFFSNKLWPSVLQPRCAGCHQVGSLAESSRMVFDPQPDADAFQDNFNIAWLMAMHLEEGESLLLRKPSGRSNQPHGGGALISEASLEHELLEHWVSRTLDLTPCADSETEETTPSDPSAPVSPDHEEEDDTSTDVTPDPGEATDLASLSSGRRILRRLSHREYDASLRAILGQPTDAAATLAADNVVNGYSNNADALVVSPLLASQYAELAEELGLRVAYHDTGYQACMAIESAANCFRDLLMTLGSRLFRRPLSNDELRRYFDLWYDIALEDGEQEGTRWAFTALLQSPHFLYRTELGSLDADHYTLSHYEIASQLAFNLTGLPPDVLLMEAAAQQRLTDTSERAFQVTRLIESEAGQAHFGQFLAAWLGLDNIATVARNAELYPDFTPGIRTDMLRQTLKTGAAWLEEDALFHELFTSSRSFVSDALADFYGIERGSSTADSHGLRETTLPNRYPAGLLSHGSVLATYAKASASSPIHRGVLVRERILCQELAPPPPNLDTSPPAIDPTKSTRERYIEHASNPACSSCHDLIDPIGFGFEHYDAVGRWRDQDGVHAIDDSGAILYSPNSDTDFSGIGELAEHLAASQDVEDCFIEQWSEYLYGFHNDAALEPSLSALKAHFAQSEKNLQATLTRFMELPHLRSRLSDLDVEESIYLVNTTPLSAPELLDGRSDFNNEAEDGGTILPPTENEGSLSVEQTEASRWNTGACFDVIVTNTSSNEQTWTIQLPIEGTINNMWNAEVVQLQGNTATIVGLSWNALLSAQASASFGYCVQF